TIARSGLRRVGLAVGEGVVVLTSAHATPPPSHFQQDCLAVTLVRLGGSHRVHRSARGTGRSAPSRYAGASVSRSEIAHSSCPGRLGYSGSSAPTSDDRRTCAGRTRPTGGCVPVPADASMSACPRTVRTAASPPT